MVQAHPAESGENGFRRFFIESLFSLGRARRMGVIKEECALGVIDDFEQEVSGRAYPTGNFDVVGILDDWKEGDLPGNQMITIILNEYFTIDDGSIAVTARLAKLAFFYFSFLRFENACFFYEADRRNGF